MASTVKKISVSLDEEDYRWAKAHAKSTKRSLSAVLNEALREQRRLAAMDKLIKAYGADKFNAADMAKIRMEIAEAEAKK
jgi:hypothetical protein